MMPANGSGEPSIFPPSPSQRHKGHFARDLALHPISGSAPDQWQCTRSEEVQCLRIGCSAPINKNKRGICRSIDATITSKLHEGRRRVELNREISRRANPLLCGEHRATANPGCGARGRGKAWPGFEIDHSEPKARVWRSRGRAAAHGAPSSPARQRQPLRRPENSRGTQQQAQQQAQQRGRKPPACAPAQPLREEPSHDALTAWRPRS